MVPDYLFYGKWHLLPLNFIVFNVIEGKSANFGTSPATEYLLSYIPDYLGLLYPFAAAGLVIFVKENLRRTRNVIPLTVAFNILLYSWIGHKETRYYFP